MSPGHNDDPAGSGSPRHEPDACRAVNELLSRVGDKWTVLVVETLCGEHPQRFNELRRAVEGISQRMLTLTLRGLERDGLVTRTVYATVPPRVEYALTPLGRTLKEPLCAIAEWAKSNRFAVAEARQAFARDRQARRPRRRVGRLAHRGREQQHGHQSGNDGHPEHMPDVARESGHQHHGEPPRRGGGDRRRRQLVIGRRPSPRGQDPWPNSPTR